MRKKTLDCDNKDFFLKYRLWLTVTWREPWFQNFFLSPSNATGIKALGWEEKEK